MLYSIISKVPLFLRITFKVNKLGRVISMIFTLTIQYHSASYIGNDILVTIFVCRSFFIYTNIVHLFYFYNNIFYIVLEYKIKLCSYHFVYLKFI